jgi:hypothetical protein
MKFPVRLQGLVALMVLAGHPVQGERISFNAARDWQDWDLPLGTVEVMADGRILPVALRKDINAVLNADKFGGGTWSSWHSPTARCALSALRSPSSSKTLELRRDFGFEGIKQSQVSWTGEGFEFIGEAGTPPRHWRTLIDQIPGEEKLRKKRLELGRGTN